MGEIFCHMCGYMNSHRRYHENIGCEVCGVQLKSCPACENSYNLEEIEIEENSGEV